jgi:hypothetical protein
MVMRFGVAGTGAGRGGPNQLLGTMHELLPSLNGSLAALCDPDGAALTKMGYSFSGASLLVHRDFLIVLHRDFPMFQVFGPFLLRFTT